MFFPGALIDARDTGVEPRDVRQLLLEAALHYCIEPLVVVALDGDLGEHVHLVLVPLLPAGVERLGDGGGVL